MKVKVSRYPHWTENEKKTDSYGKLSWEEDLGDAIENSLSDVGNGGELETLTSQNEVLLKYVSKLTDVLVTKGVLSLEEVLSCFPYQCEKSGRTLSSIDSDVK